MSANVIDLPGMRRNRLEQFEANPLPELPGWNSLALRLLGSTTADVADRDVNRMFKASVDYLYEDDKNGEKFVIGCRWIDIQTTVSDADILALHTWLGKVIEQWGLKAS